MKAKRSISINKKRIFDFSRKAGTIAFLLLSTIGVVISTFFATTTTFRQTDRILINEASYVMADNQVVLAQLQNRHDRDNTVLNPNDWPLFVKTFNKTLGYNSSVFKTINDNFSATTPDNLFVNDVLIADITTYLYNPISSSNNIVFLTDENMKYFGDQSIIIEKHAADQIINASAIDTYSTYNDLYNYPIIIQNNAFSDTYYVSGVYDNNRDVYRRDFNGIFGELGNTYFISTNAAMKYGMGKIYVSFTNDYAVNQIIFSFLRKLICDHNLLIQIPNLEINNIDVNGISLYRLREAIVGEYNDIYNILLSVLMWLITISLVVIIVDVFDDVRKMLSVFFLKKKMQTISLSVSITILTLFFFVGSTLQATLFKYYYLNGYIIDFLFPGSVTTLIGIFAIILILCFLTSYRAIAFSKVKNLEFLNIDELLNPFDNITKQAITQVYNTSYTKNAFIIGGLSLPSESAGANRIKASVKILNECGMKCHVLGYYAGDVGKPFEYEPGYDIIPYHDLRKTDLISKIKAFLFPSIFIKRIIQEFTKNRNSIDLIYIYSALSVGAVMFLKKFAKKNGIKFVYDVVEFQIFTQQNIKTFFTYFVPNQIINRFLIRKGDKVIAISSFLRNFFAKRKCEPFVMPYVNDSKNLIFTGDNKVFKKTDKKIFMYAGSPFGRRDLIAEMVKGFLMLDEETQKSIIVVFAGINAIQCLNEGLTNEEIEKASKCCVFLGKIPHKNVAKLYQIADYSILLKPEKKRFSHAGFPTKIAESWGYGVPVVANYSSDLKDFMVDGYNSFVSNSSSPIDFRNALLRAVKTERKHLIEMRENSRVTSETKLDYRQYKDGLLTYLGICTDKE